MRKLAGDLYRALAAPFGARALDRMLRDGLPPRLGPPLRFLFTAQLPPDVCALAARIEARRIEIAACEDMYQFAYQPSALATARWPERMPAGSEEPAICLRFLANHASVPQRWGKFLHLCAQQFEARAILELGACVGISSAYLASVPSNPRFVTIEGSPALADIAQKTLAKFSDRAAVLCSAFESGMQQALEQVAPVDVAYIDGHHDETPTLHYVRTLLPHLSNDALIILDDIRLYPGMRRAWAQLSTMAGVAAAVNTGRFGLLVWHGGNAIPHQFDLARYTGVWRSRERNARP